jgi:hypothetical protein
VLDDGPVECRAVHPRHFQVADDRVEGAAGRGLEPGLAVAGVRHQIAGIPQTFDDGRGQSRLVLDQQYRRAGPRLG